MAERSLGRMRSGMAWSLPVALIVVGMGLLCGCGSRSERSDVPPPAAPAEAVAPVAKAAPLPLSPEALASDPLAPDTASMERIPLEQAMAPAANRPPATPPAMTPPPAAPTMTPPPAPPLPPGVEKGVPPTTPLPPGVTMPEIPELPDTGLRPDVLNAMSVDELRQLRDATAAQIETQMAALHAREAQPEAPRAGSEGELLPPVLPVETLTLRSEIRDLIRDRIILDRAIEAREADGSRG